NEKLSDVLYKLLKPRNITYEVVGHNIILSQQPQLNDGSRREKTSMKSEVQEHVITGTVTDEDGLTIPGVNVLLKGTVIGTVTDLIRVYSFGGNDIVCKMVI